MKRILLSSIIAIISLTTYAQDRELLIIGAMHQVPDIVSNCYAPLLKYAVRYAPDAVMTEDNMPDDSLSTANYTPRFVARADSALAVAPIDEARMQTTLSKQLDEMSHDDFVFLRECFLRRKDRANYYYYAYLAEYGIEGSKKAHGNETDDLNHKLAIAMGIKELLPIDDHSDMRYDSAWVEAVNSGVENGDIHIYSKLTKKDNRARVLPALMGRLGRYTNRRDVLERYYLSNSVRYVKYPNEKTEAARSIWDERNMRMARHIADQLAAADSHRAVLVVGAGHVVSLRNALAEIDPGIKVVLMD